MSYVSKLAKNYVWWIERERVGIGEYDKNKNVDCMTSPTSASNGLKMRLLETRRGSDFGSVLTASPEIPSQFHEALAYKVIAMGYLRGDNINPQLAQYFEGLYAKTVKQAKKYAKSRHLSTGSVRPQDF